MYLKRLEIQGFKSMADKVELHFNPGITAVVGPNGSGKSNISDAIRWVLGEQSAKSLRGAKMEDIIFSGSDKRKPVGMAEVVLTLDNSTGIFPSEYSEITVARRVFRSGESEFFINKTHCRLKDIHELFMDTGIGREGYSIIGQGKIDEILSTKSEDRRLVIEEAAGIVKYKNRKNQAVRRLEDTEQNLVRISDILAELEMQVGPLEEQASKARTYISHKEELDKLEINLCVHQLSDQKERLNNLVVEENGLREKVISLETEVRKTDSVIEELKHTLNLTNEEISSLQQQVYEKNSNIEKMESEIRLNEERSRNLMERRERLQSEIAVLQEKIEEIKGQSANDAEAYEIVRSNTSQIEKEITILEQELGQLESQNRDQADGIENLKVEIFDTLNKIAGLNNQFHGLEAERKTLVKRKEQLTAQLNGVLSEQEQLNADINKIVEKEELTTAKISELDTNIQKHLVDINNCTFQRQQVVQEINSLAEQKQNLASKLKVLDEMEQDYDGYHKGVRETMKAGREGLLSGICGVLAELISVPGKYETAIEIALGSALQFVVCDNDGDAKSAIDYLKKRHLGRATFLPLSTVKTKDLRDLEKIRGYKGCLGVAAELISFENKYTPAVKNLLGNIIVADHMDAALKIARETGFNIKIVTLDGEVISPGGSMTGGSLNKNRSNLLGRKREIEELSKAVEQFTEKITGLKQKEEEIAKSGQTVTEQLEKSKEDLQTANLAVAGIKAEKEQLAIQLNKLSQTVEVYRFETGELDGRLNDLDKLNGKLQAEIIELQELHEKLNQQVVDTQANMSAAETQKSSLNEQLTGKKIELAKLKQEEISLHQVMERVDRDIREVEKQISDKNTESATIENQQQELQNQAAGIQQQIVNLVEEKLKSEENLAELRNKRDFYSGEITVKEENSKSSFREFNQIQGQIHSIEVKKARLETEIENALSKLTEEFSLTYEEALLQKTELESKTKAAARIKELKSLIVQLGSVNLTAIEEYEKVKERFEFLSTQYNDLEEAKSSLYRVIEEMDQIMSKRFRKAYEEINNNFQVVFSDLFGGGRAELQMTDSDRILETGIEIIAQPPGKKPQHLSLLSGGERALTAISLLFAVLLVKPSPFCVLDEIEASLDEANVDRFAGFLQKLSTTQFIVVTHRKGTMEAANVLYGVTMDETGVSKLVSMKLAELEDKVS